MASAQVLPNSGASSSRKDHLEAGKRRLEEFRKKKAEGRAKKVASGPTQSIDDSQYEKQPQDKEPVRQIDSDRAAGSERNGAANRDPPTVVRTDDTKAIDSSRTNELDVSFGSHTSRRASDDTSDAFYADSLQKPANGPEPTWYDGSRTPDALYVNHDHSEEEKTHKLGNARSRGPAYEAATDQYIARHPVYEIGDNDSNIHKSNYHSKFEGQSRELEMPSKDYPGNTPGISNVFDSSISSERSARVEAQNTVGFGSMMGSGNIITKAADSFPQVKKNMRGDLDFTGAKILDGRKKFSNSNNHLSSIESAQWRSSESVSSTDYSQDFRSSLNRAPVYPATSETGTRRVRPSFLDELNVSRVSSELQSSFTDSQKAETLSDSTFEAIDPRFLVSSANQQSTTDTVIVDPFDKIRNPYSSNSYETRYSPSISDGNEGQLLDRSVTASSMERFHEFPSLKQDDNFAALEQHIEDLTQEKFSLQRALDASRVLSESLATENSTLTDSYNQQGAVVNQLKSDMERLQEEIRAQLLEIESVKMEYANAQLECDASDERAKILASEVIGLEEKALRLRSNELKLERQLENSNAEINSYRKKVSSLEKERQDLQFTIAALQEEKKLLQSKLRKASGSGNSIDIIKTPSVKHDVSTSTEDLGAEISELIHAEASDESTPHPSNLQMQDVGSFPSSSSPTLQLPENRDFHLSDSSASIPPDQLRTIGNIKSLISELALEKEELLRALASESSQSSNLKELNKELSRKLEVQTQRLELLTAQSMVNENTPARPTDSRTVHDNTAYTDEGDEVVERVLGWIMKLFPGGPSKRRTSKLL